MTKSIFKEIIIVLLLILAIILILGVILYEYVPSNKIIPEQISYTTPDNVKTEIESQVNFEEEEVVLKYTIDATDLQNYKKVNEYVPGKSNPFAAPKKDDELEENTESNGNTVTNSNNDSSENIENNNSTGYIPDKGTK